LWYTAPGNLAKECTIKLVLISNRKPSAPVAKWNRRKGEQEMQIHK